MIWHERYCSIEPFRLFVTGELEIKGCLEPEIDDGIFDSFSHLMSTADMTLGGLRPGNAVRVGRCEKSVASTFRCPETARHLSDIGFHLLSEVATGLLNPSTRLETAPVSCSSLNKQVNTIASASSRRCTQSVQSCGCLYLRSPVGLYYGISRWRSSESHQ